MRLTLVLTVVAVLILPGCIKSGEGPLEFLDPEPREQSGGSPHAPAWTVNDHWVLRSFTDDEPDRTRAVADHFVQAIDILESDGTQMDAFRVVSQQDNTTTWYRMSDLALMKHHQVGGLGLLETVYTRPCAMYQWPLSVGATWEDACTRNGPNGSSVLNFTARVQGEETVSVPSGNFTTFVIQYNGTDGDQPFQRTEYFAPGACFTARAVEPQPVGTLVRELLAYQCAALSSK